MVTTDLTGYQNCPYLPAVADLREDAIIQLTRLGLNGDVPSVARFAKQFLRRAATDEAITDATKEALGELVAKHQSKPIRFVEASPATNPAGFLSVEPEAEGEEPLLSADVAHEVDAILNEHMRASDLADAGLVPTRTVLLTGPPGVGKTITARSMAHRLGVPLFRADLSALMSSYLGKTGQNLREALVHARSIPSVMLLDEFDAIAKRRDDPTDVGELKRVVNVLLLELEAWPSSSLLVAATNHPELLDRAIWRRFEKIIEIGLPVDEARAILLRRRLAKFNRSAQERTVQACISATSGLSCSDVVSLANACIKKSILSGEAIDSVLCSEIRGRLLSQAQTDPDRRKMYCEFASHELGMTHRDIGRELSVSHVWVGNLLRASDSSSPPKRSPQKGGARE